MVAMHLGLIDMPFVPHNLIPVQESPLPLLDFQMAPRLEILTLDLRREPRHSFSFLSKHPGK
jgi:hypothetical protein